MSLTLDNTKRLEVIDGKIGSLQNVLDLHIKDTDKEIGDLGQLRIDVATLQESVKELGKILDRHVDRVSNRVDQAVAPILEESQGLREEIMDKTIIKIRETFWEGIKKLIQRR